MGEGFDVSLGPAKVMIVVRKAFIDVFQSII